MPKTFRILALSLVGLALLLAIIAIGLGKRDNATTPSSGSQQAAGENQVPRQTIVVAARALSAGKAVSLSDMKSIEVEQLPAGSVSSLYQFDGAIPARDIAADMPLRAELFLSGLSSHLAQGERAIAIAVDEISGVGNRVAPGDYVDVFLALPEQRSSQGNEPGPASTRMLASRLRVLSYGQNSIASDLPAEPAPAAQSQLQGTSAETDSRAQAITARSQNSTGSNSARTAASSAVLAVPPDQAAALLLGAQEGRLLLALRHPGDTTVADRGLLPAPASMLRLQGKQGQDGSRAEYSADDLAYAGLTLNGLTGKGGNTPSNRPAPTASRPAPPRAPAAGSSVQIIRGSDAPRPLASH